MTEQDPNFSPQQMYETLQRVGTAKEETSDKIYAPPPGRPHYDESVAKYKYIPDEPTMETMQLEPHEKTHLYDLAWKMCSIFDAQMQPVPDAIYTTLPQVQRASLLQVVVSRTGIKRIDANRIAWPALLVVVKEIPVIKVVCTLDFSKDVLQIWQIIFWRNDTGQYEKPITRGDKPIPPEMVVEFINRYKQAEGL